MANATAIRKRAARIVSHVSSDNRNIAMSGFLTSDQLRALKRTWRSATQAPGYAGSDGRPCIGIASSFTADPLIPYLGARLLAAGEAQPHIRQANYNQVMRVCF
jgi:hypothetical protein